MRLVHLVLLFFFFIVVLFVFFFFFSSRRRHTRSLRDWSSDVCSSDLARIAFSFALIWRHPPYHRPRAAPARAPRPQPHPRQCPAYPRRWRRLAAAPKIGRASCRERV